MYVLMDGVQVPVVAAETEGRTGRIEGQRARTRECKLGCVFTQTTVDKEGWPIRDPDSTTYVGAIETAEEFGFRIYTEAWRRGWEWATIKVVLGDGAVWIWNLADQHFPGAIQIVDLYHARQHLWKIAALLHPQDPVAKKLWMIPMKELLDDGNIEPLVARLREIAAEHADASRTGGGGFKRGRILRHQCRPGCAIRSFVKRDSSSAPAWLKLAASPSSDRV